MLFLRVWIPEILPEHMVPGKELMVEYGSTQQRHSSRGLKPRHVTVVRQGRSDEMDYYKHGMEVKPGVWVLDHYDSDREKFFYHHRLVSIQPKLSIDDLI